MYVKKLYTQLIVSLPWNSSTVHSVLQPDQYRIFKEKLWNIMSAYNVHFPFLLNNFVPNYLLICSKF